MRNGGPNHFTIKQFFQVMSFTTTFVNQDILLFRLETKIMSTFGARGLNSI